MIYGCVMAQAVSRRPPNAEARVRSWVSPRGICGGQSGTGTGFPRVFRSSFANSIPSVLNYQENYNNNNMKKKKLHHTVAQWALRLRCVRSVCCGVLLHKKLKSWYGVLCCGFSFKFFNPLPSASSKPILHTLSHCQSLSHSHIEVSWTATKWQEMTTHRI
jgi:hypothetical protein